MLDYEFIIYHYWVIAVDLGRQNELDTDPKAIQRIEFVGLLKRLKSSQGRNNT